MDDNERVLKITAKVSVEEQEVIEQAAKIRGLPASALLRMLALDHARSLGLTIPASQ